MRYALQSRYLNALLIILFVATSLSCSKNGRDSSEPTSFTSVGQGSGQAALAGTITVTVRAIRNDNGQARFALYAGEDGFPGEVEVAAATQFTSISGGVATIRFDNIPYGEYAIAVVHDEDSNDELNTNFLGMPREGVGVSNDATGSFGPPDYEDAAFRLEASELELVITMTYI